MLLIAAPALAQTQAPQPYLVVIPSSGAPGIVEKGTQAGLYGSNFCTPGCSPVTLTIGNDLVAPRILATVQVNGDGTFTLPFTASVPFAWRYLIKASQTTGTGSVLSASVPIIVPQSDEIPVSQPPPPQNRRAGGREKRPSPKAIVALGGPSGVTEVAPNEAYDGRSVAVDVSSTHNAVAIAASESGGLWKTTDTGATWTLLSGLPTFRMSDVKMAPSNDQIVIATSWFDSHVTNGGGIWRSTDGGTNWQKPAGADPTSCSPPYNTWGISFAPTTNDVFVGTDCGVSISHDLGATWSQVVLPNVYGIWAQPGAGGTIVDTCGSDGHRRSTNGGATFTPSSSALPGCPGIGVQTIVASPLEPNVLFAAIDQTHVYESDNGGVSWSNLNPPANSGSREPWVATHLSADGNSRHFDIYFGSGLNTYRQTCTNTGGPGLRCSTSWSGSVTIDHSDQNGLAFSSSSNCAQFIVSDGGIHSTPDCGNTWNITGNGPGGYHALQVYEVNGEVHPSQTDLYFGTQDNELWASANNGLTWINPVCCEGFYIQTLHDSPSDTGQKITFVSCSGCGNNDSAADFASSTGWNNPPGGGGNPFIVAQGVYLQWSSPSPPASQLYISTNTGSSWSAVSGASTTLQLADRPFISGPSANPTVYQEVQRPGNVVGLIKITGVRSGSATITNADTGLNNIGFWSEGQGTYRFAQVFGVDPNNPLHLIVADIGNNAMMVSVDGGTTWNPDNHLTNLVTGFGQFQFSQPSTTFPGLTTEAHTIAFDPSNGNRILVGTEQAGIIVSTDGGNTWGLLAGSTAVPAVSSFFFDEVQKDVFASSYGRGLWSLNLAQLVTFPPMLNKIFAAATVPLTQSAALTFSISNPNQVTTLTGVGFSDALPAGLVVSSPNGLTNSCGGTVTATPGTSSVSLSGVSLAGSASCVISVNVTGTTAGVKNNTTGAVTSNEGGLGSTASASITVVAPPSISKAFGAATVPLNHNTSLTITITNPNTTVALTGVGFTDTLPSGLEFVSLNSLVGCGLFSTEQDAGSLTVASVSVAASGTCTLTLTVTGTAAGVENNTTANVTSDNGGTGNTASASIIVVAPPVISKAFGLLAIPVGESTSLTFTILNPNLTVALTVSFSDMLPAGLVVSTPNALTGSCGAGTIAAVPGSNVIGLASGTIPATAACTFSVSVTGTKETIAINSVTVNSVEGGTGNTATAQITVGNAFSVTYAANLNVGDSFIDFTNSGSNDGSNLCLNVYVFDPAEELIACCTCSVTPNGLQSLSVLQSLTSDPLTPSVPTAIVIKTIATAGPTCDASTATADNLAPGALAWSTTLHQAVSGFSPTEKPFTPAALSAAELTHITSTCGFIEGNGSGFGTCKGCTPGGLGVSNGVR